MDGTNHFKEATKELLSVKAVINTNCTLELSLAAILEILISTPEFPEIYET